MEQKLNKKNFFRIAWMYVCMFSYVMLCYNQPERWNVVKTISTINVQFLTNIFLPSSIK